MGNCSCLSNFSFSRRRARCARQNARRATGRHRLQHGLHLGGERPRGSRRTGRRGGRGEGRAGRGAGAAPAREAKRTGDFAKSRNVGSRSEFPLDVPFGAVISPHPFLPKIARELRASRRRSAVKAFFELASKAAATISANLGGGSARTIDTGDDESSSSRRRGSCAIG